MKSMIVNLGFGPDIQLGLNTHQVISTTEACGLAIEVLRGSVWITFEGRREDLVLKPGERLPVNTRGRTVLQGLEPSELKFVRQSLAFRQAYGSRHVAQKTANYWRSLVGTLSNARLNIDYPI